MRRDKRTRQQAHRQAWRVLWRMRGWLSGERWKDFKLMRRDVK